MRNLSLGNLNLAVFAIGALTAISQPPGSSDNRDGAPRGGPGGGAPRFELGRLVPPFARQELNLTKDQEAEIAKLEQDVKQRLSQILTDEQQKKLESLRPPRPGGRGGAGGPAGGRPGGRGSPPDGNRPNQPDKLERRDKPSASGDQPKAESSGAGIQWFATWESGLNEAVRTARPMLLVSAAPHCAGVPGIW